jgi:hypothetical protein
MEFRGGLDDMGSFLTTPAPELWGIVSLGSEELVDVTIRFRLRFLMSGKGGRVSEFPSDGIESTPYWLCARRTPSDWLLSSVLT